MLKKTVDSIKVFVKFWQQFVFLQSIQAPNGLIAHMFGPIEGRRHDAFMLGVSDLLPKLQGFVQPNG